MRRLFTPKWLLGHVLVWTAVAAFLALGWWQAGRALEGNMLSWAYTFEWPLFAIFLVFMWIREMRLALGRGPVARSRPEKRGPVITRRVATEVAQESDDPKLDDYNRYLAWLNEHPEARPSDYRV